MASCIGMHAQRLADGVDGADVLQSLRECYKTTWSFNKSVSRTRRAFLQLGVRHGSFEEDCERIDALLPATERVAWEAFKSMSLTEQYDKQRRGNLFAAADLNVAMQSMRLLPDNLKTFVLSEDDLVRASELQQAQLVRKNTTAIKFADSWAHLQRQLRVLADENASIAALCVALLFVSGRREAEILNGRSRFEPARTVYHARFVGQVKRRHGDEPELTIPLLCDFATFRGALDRLRKKQRPDVPSLTNAQISARYSGRVLAQHRALLPMVPKPHDLRCVYIQYVNHMFNHTLAIPALCMRCLGHDIIQTTLHYMTCTVAPDERLTNANGPLDI